MGMLFGFWLMVLVCLNKSVNGCQDASDEDVKVAYEVASGLDGPPDMSCHTRADSCGILSRNDTVADVIKSLCPATCGTCTGSECHTLYDASDYRGSVNKTRTGATCQKWTSQSPNQHTRTPARYPESGLGYHNYCRNPDHEPEGAYCYTANGERWELCFVGLRSTSCD